MRREQIILEMYYFAHPHSVDLHQLYRHVLELDARYSTNRYNMPMVEVIGFLSMRKYFHVAFAFIKYEKDDSHLWIMRLLVNVFQWCSLDGSYCYK